MLKQGIFCSVSCNKFDLDIKCYAEALSMEGADACQGARPVQAYAEAHISG
jgi:hypothetical protein